MAEQIVDWDDAYANTPHIPEGEAYPDRWKEAAAAFRAGLAADRRREGLPYGRDPRETVDIFLPEGTAPGVVVFVHGGYWLRFDRSCFSHLAAGALQRGWVVAVPSYPLAPEARISAITAAIGGAVTQIAAAMPGRIVLAGHSAGGHLVTRQICEGGGLPERVASRVDRVVTISGLHDLRPLLRLALNADLRLDPAEADAESPALLYPRAGSRVHVWVGDQERPEFVRQSTLLANIWTGLRAEMEQTIAPGRHHFSVIEPLTEPDSDLVSALVG
ncbi:alpha/beta hydrolase [Amaricoccus sp.]|uniref:alpha/beta hydrolase n=1 Tax=Amaricoccus sp. TaxID=1872485 RepID=UPI001B4830E3|nr:alpha/beta hydrolase [Amaricoccus sp.]MBP7242266.1 alpha/beta hydrolase [Amaricoccus sp.]